MTIDIETVSSWQYALEEKVLMGKAENNLQKDYPDSNGWQNCQKGLDKN